MPHATERQTKQKPELKIGPFAGGIGVAIWRNAVDTEQGRRQIRSITINPRRYRDPETGQWKDSGSFRPIDLPALILALQKAYDHSTTTPIPGQEDSTEMGEDMPF